MADDHWLEHASGGRRWFLKGLPTVPVMLKWSADKLVSALVGALIGGTLNRAPCPTAPRHIVMKAERGEFHVVTDNVSGFHHAAEVHWMLYGRRDSRPLTPRNWPT